MLFGWEGNHSLMENNVTIPLGSWLSHLWADYQETRISSKSNAGKSGMGLLFPLLAHLTVNLWMIY